MNFAQTSMLGKRECNEDSIISLEKFDKSLFVVADGLGGHDKGEVASAIATETFKELFENDTVDADAFLSEAMTAAQNNILREQKTQHAAHEMKTTCAALLIANDVCLFGHIGDSRVYVFQNNKVKLRTYDHSVSQMLVMSGEIKEKQIRSHKDRNRLLRVMGIEWDSPKFELSEKMNLHECQAFLLCTDGLWEFCDEKKMCACLKKSADAAQWLKFMVDEVERNGRDKNMDNYSAIAVVR